MRSYLLAAPALEVVHPLRAKTEAAHCAPEPNIGAPEKEYVIEEEFDRAAFGGREPCPKAWTRCYRPRRDLSATVSQSIILSVRG